MWIWVAFIAFVLLMLALDLGVFHHKAHIVSVKDALAWSAVWLSMGLSFSVFVYYTYDGQWFGEVHEHFQSAISEDAEMLYAVGLMAQLAPWLLGDLATWEARSEEYRRKYRELAPHGLQPSIFAGRGAYGDYFGDQAKVEGGY